jgi:hypothetical protein
MKKLFKILSLGLTTSIALSSVPAQAVELGDTAKTFVRGTKAAARGLAEVCATAYENAHVLRLIAISGLAGIGAYATFTKLNKSFQKEHQPKGFVQTVVYGAEAGTRRAATGALILASLLGFEFIRRGFVAELDANDAAVTLAKTIADNAYRSGL